MLSDRSPGERTSAELRVKKGVPPPSALAERETESDTPAAEIPTAAIEIPVPDGFPVVVPLVEEMAEAIIPPLPPLIGAGPEIFPPGAPVVLPPGGGGVFPPGGGGVVPPGPTPPGPPGPPSPIPEPATWLSMLMGFMLLGWRLRHRTALPTPASAG